MTTDTAQAPECMIFLLSKAYQKGHGLVKKRLLPFGLTNMQYVILETLWMQDGLTAVELSMILAIDKATLSGVLERMAEGGWIEKQNDDRDRRAIRVFLTARANRMKESLQKERQAANDELLSMFTIEEKVLLRRLLKDMA
ncbi:MarR family winged helix-turn-helix transcriptional regulator [Desulfosudis oleivorans]|uniref:Transcriptional regulator, MarR family n=1 Tax=Desulfosudis oleivorans (strain DSM 6200 / JCM 39069 / Hxd3) TaxID=96561 RepID=A9A024_DESOH|nr:MarR family transcriptional regulator [Desulfosudis oleivorans]ABW67424.1 transcriptional regulator, MarR family [Desulfosudis oleivorans Hxd3]